MADSNVPQGAPMFREPEPQTAEFCMAMAGTWGAKATELEKAFELLTEGQGRVRMSMLEGLGKVANVIADLKRTEATFLALAQQYQGGPVGRT